MISSVLFIDREKQSKENYIPLAACSLDKWSRDDASSTRREVNDFKGYKVTFIFLALFQKLLVNKLLLKKWEHKSSYPQTNFWNHQNKQFKYVN